MSGSVDMIGSRWIECGDEFSIVVKRDGEINVIDSSGGVFQVLRRRSSWAIDDGEPMKMMLDIKAALMKQNFNSSNRILLQN